MMKDYDDLYKTGEESSLTDELKTLLRSTKNLAAVAIGKAKNAASEKLKEHPKLAAQLEKAQKFGGKLNAKAKEMGVDVVKMVEEKKKAICAGEGAGILAMVTAPLKRTAAGRKALAAGVITMK